MTPTVIERIAGLPKTHRVVTVGADGRETIYDAHSAASAENYAVRMRRMIQSGEAISVTIDKL